MRKSIEEKQFKKYGSCYQYYSVKMIYRNVKKSEYEDLAIIHLASFKGFFLTSLGKSFLQTYYKASLKSRESITICAENENNLMVGFCTGCIQSKNYHKKLIRQNLVLFLIQGFIVVFSRPKAFFRLLGNLDKRVDKTDDGIYAELLSIGILPEVKGAGIGKNLMKKFEEEALAKACNKVTLTTDYNNNEQVLEFYKRAGYKVLYEFTTYPNRKMYKMIKNLSN